MEQMSEQAQIVEAPQPLATSSTTIENMEAGINDQAEPRNPPAEEPPVVADAQSNPTGQLRELLGRAQQLHQRSLNSNELLRCCTQCIATLAVLFIKLATLAAVCMTPFTFYQAYAAEESCASNGVMWVLFIYGIVQIGKTFCEFEESCLSAMLFIFGNIFLFTRESCTMTERINLVLMLISFAHLYLGTLLVLAVCACCACCCLVVLISCLTGRRPNISGLLRNKEKALAAVQPKEGIDPLIECSICFEKELDSELPCHHQFHKTCIENWFGSKTTCPVCRMELG